jgi:hypothetical protein
MSERTRVRSFKPLQRRSLAAAAELCSSKSELFPQSIADIPLLSLSLLAVSPNLSLPASLSFQGEASYSHHNIALLSSHWSIQSPTQQK